MTKAKTEKEVLVIIPKPEGAPKEEETAMFSRDYTKFYVPYGKQIKVPFWVYECAVDAHLIEPIDFDED